MNEAELKNLDSNKSSGRLRGAHCGGQSPEGTGNNITREYEPCYYTSISSQGVEDSAWQQSNWGEYRQLSLWKSIPTHSSSSDTTSQECQFTQISETTTQNQENLTSLQWDSPALEHQTQEVEQDSSIQLHLFGEKGLEYCSKLNPSSVLWNSLKELSDEDFELFLGDLVWQDILLKLKQSRRQALELDNRGTDCLSFPTLTSGQTSTKMRPAGQVKCEKWFKDNGLIQPGYQLSAQAMALIMGFPPNWFDCLSPVKPQEESEPDISQDEQSPQHKQPLPSAESYISTQLLGGDENSPLSTESSSSLSQNIFIPCLVKQPKQPEVRGLIKQDLGDCPKGSGGANRFDVYIPDSDSTITVSKLFVYPDLSQLDKCSRKNLPASKKCSSKQSPPSKTPPSKIRRQKGEGSGAIFYRTVTRNGRDYQQAYYHWRENGKQRTKYIPKKLLDKVKQAESRKLPV
ncbi:MAG: hypothetical protein QNJ53_20555, partial [Pleurocapsa sp. MO_192.B19]|nr:hypothetical protein [Pleurocapsa sp. MO_192.B19]